jgi:hypothetical protein
VVTFGNNTPNPVANLQVACGGASNCQASFTMADSVGYVYCYNQSAGSNGGAFTSSWVVDGQGSGSAMNPVFPLSAGMHTICLTISDNTGCTSTYCDSIYVQGGGGSNCQVSFGYQVSGNTVSFNGYSSNTSGSVLYVWNFGNGTSAYQQYTTQTLANGTYNVCLSILDSVTMCQNSTCQTITINNVPATNIHGWVYSDSTTGGTDTIRVWLIEYNAAAGTLTAVDSQTTVSNGAAYYNFANASGTYLVKAALFAGPGYATNLPTYYSGNNFGVLYWASATQVQASASNYNIYLVQGLNPGGPGFIGGLVSQGANKMSGAAIPNAEVLLLDVNDNPIAYTYSDANGNFSFPNLAYGTYKVYTEVLNKVTYPVLVTISANHASENGVSIEINSTYVGGSVSAVENAAYAQNLKVYPNPATSNATLSLNLKQAANVEVSLQNVMGQKVWNTTEKMSAGAQEVTISTQNLPKGVYFLKVAANGATQETKLVKE